MTTYGGLDFWNEHSPLWPTVPLRKVASLGTGHTPSRSEPEYWVDCTIPWVTTADLTARKDGGLQPLMETSQHISELGVANSAAVLHPTDTVMLSRTASIGHSVRIGRPMATTQAFVTWTCGPQLDPRYLLLVMKAMTPEFDRLAYGSTHLTIYFPDIEQLRVPLPPLAIQRAIADYLDTETARIDALIAKKQRMIALLDEAFVAEIGAACAELLQTSPIKRVAGVSYGLGQPPALSEPASGTVPIIRATNINRGKIESADLIHARIEDLPLCRAPLLSEGEILVVRSGALTGDSARITGQWAGAAPGYDLRVSPKSIDSRLLAWQLLGEEVWAQLQLVRMRAAQPHLNAEDLGAVIVRRGSPAAEARVANRLDLVAERSRLLAERLDRQIELLRERRQGLITAAVTGELEVPGVAS